MPSIPQVTTRTDWYKDAIIYEVHVRAFRDSNGDGIGDFPGLTERLDYLADLGVTAIWLLPFYPSPLRDDGYDIADYMAVHPDYGTLDDFRTFLEAAHARRLRVITELVVNHTSDQHGWFQRARRAPAGSVERDFYVWSPAPDKYLDARIIFSDTETSNWAYDPVADAYYWHRFFSHQPDLNFENPAVRDALYEVVDFWLGMGVDGMRLDAVPYLYEEEGTMCENLPATHQELKRLRAHVDERFDDRMLLAEANQWPEDAIAYFGDGDECHMAYHFPVMPRLFMAIRQEHRFPIIDILDQTPAIPESCQWALFLRNHDELTLEMVTDEERDYMYRTYAKDRRARINLGIRRRLAPLLQNDRREIELMNALLMSLPGTPIVYYGDEIGMGDNIFLGDRNGVRTPMQWSSDKNAGFSSANPQRLYFPTIIDPEYHYETVNVEAQQRNATSLLWWTRRLLSLRKQHPVFGRGDIHFLDPDNDRVLAFIRSTDEERVLVVANLSSHNQYVELDLSSFAGRQPVDLFGRNPFPAIGDLPYLLTLAPHAFYWFALVEEGAELGRPSSPSHLVVLGGPEALFHDASGDLEAVIRTYLRRQVWFGGRRKRLRAIEISDRFMLGPGSFLVLVDAQYLDGEGEVFVLPLALLQDDEADQALRQHADRILGEVEVDGHPAVLVDQVWHPAFVRAMFELVVAGGQIEGVEGRLVAAGHDAIDLPSFDRIRVHDASEGHTRVIVGEDLVLKLARRLESGPNPDLELRRHLTDRTAFTNHPPVEGWIDHQGVDRAMLGIVQAYVPNIGAARTTFRSLLEACLDAGDVSAETRLPFDLIGVEPEPEDAPLLRTSRERARQLGRRIGELHLALSSREDDPDLRPQRFSTLSQRALYQSVRTSVRRALRDVRRPDSGISQDLRPRVTDPAFEQELLASIDWMRNGLVHASVTRIHGDLRLDEVLDTGDDFVFHDFGGDGSRPLSERRLRRSPLQDVADVLRSFHYVVYAVVHDRSAGHDTEALALTWYRWTAAALLGGYLAETADATFNPSEPSEARRLLEALMLDRAGRELQWELHHRPEWVAIPLMALRQLAGSGLV